MRTAEEEEFRWLRMTEAEVTTTHGRHVVGPPPPQNTVTMQCVWMWMGSQQ